MLLVLLVHYVGADDLNLGSDFANNPFAASLHIELHALSVVCVNCFILISGYFGIRWKARSFLSLIYQVLFWLIIGFGVAYFLNMPSAGSALKATYIFFGHRWFVPAYLCLYILAPLLNDFIGKASERKLGWYIIAFYTYSTLIGYFCHSSEFNEGMSAISLVGLYLIGAYLRKTSLKIFKLKPTSDLGIYFLLSLGLTLLNIVVLKIGINKSPFGYLNPVVILESVYLFLFFQKINIGYIKAINFIAASAFAVYLFHMHPWIEGEYFRICREIGKQGLQAAWMAPALFLAIFVFCVILDRIRIFSFRGLESLFLILKGTNNSNHPCADSTHQLEDKPTA